MLSRRSWGWPTSSTVAAVDASQQAEPGGDRPACNPCWRRIPAPAPARGVFGGDRGADRPGDRFLSSGPSPENGGGHHGSGVPARIDGHSPALVTGPCQVDAGIALAAHHLPPRASDRGGPLLINFQQPAGHRLPEFPPARSSAPTLPGAQPLRPRNARAGAAPGTASKAARQAIGPGRIATPCHRTATQRRFGFANGASSLSTLLCSRRQGVRAPSGR